DQIAPALHEDPALPDSTPLDLARELEAALRMVPEEIVDDEDVVAGRAEVVRHGADRPLPEGAIVQLPYGAEGAAEGTAAGRLDGPDRLEDEAVIAPAQALDEGAGGPRYLVQAGALLERRRGDPTAFGPDTPRRNGRDGAAGGERIREGRHDLLAVVQRDRVDGRVLERDGVRGGGMTAREDERSGREPPDLACEVQDLIELERVHRRDAD